MNLDDNEELGGELTPSSGVRKSPPSKGTAMTHSATYTASRITYDSAHDFTETRARFDERAPLLDPALFVDLVVGDVGWDQVEVAVGTRLGPHSLAALARLDQGALLSLNGRPLDATLYLVGNPLVARRLTDLDPAAALYARFRVVVYGDAAGAHIAYDQPSTVFNSLGSAAIDEIALDLDQKIAATVKESI